MISEKAYIAPGAKIGKNVTIYPFAYIEDDVVIGDDCIIYPYVSIMRGTVMGRGNKVYQNTVLGAEPQDFNHKGEATRLVIGDENIFRENVVVNRATYTDGETRIGNRNFFMEGVHISHDTKRGRLCYVRLRYEAWQATVRFTVPLSSLLVSLSTRMCASVVRRW